MDIDLEDLLASGQGAARRARVTVEARNGRYRRARALHAGEKPVDLALDATVRRAAGRRIRSQVEPSSEHLSVARSESRVHAISPKPSEDGTLAAVSLRITPADFCRKVRVRPCDTLIVLAVDASDSMGEGTQARMKAAKGAVLALLRRAYQSRSRVALVAFGGESATVVLPPTRSIARAKTQLERMPAGGATPFADGLFKSWQIIRRERLKNPGVRPVLLVVSDGEANVPLGDGVPTWRELLDLAAKLRHAPIASVLIDVAAEAGKGVEMKRLAAQMGAGYLKVTDLKPRHILDAVAETVARPGSAFEKS
ncbi:MAG: VWA domain-containing protein [Verrucomicrobia bacterium]|nr:VWA domain-containing protein [Verrucomicrobiota bacterium]